MLATICINITIAYLLHQLKISRRVACTSLCNALFSFRSLRYIVNTMCIHYGCSIVLTAHLQSTHKSQKIRYKAFFVQIKS